MEKIKNFIQGIKNLFYYLPYIWKDRDWDFSYTLFLLQVKLQKQLNYTKSRMRHERASIDCRDMQNCITLIERVQSGYYSDEYFEYYKSDLVSKPYKGTEFYEIVEENVIEDLDTYFKKYPKVYEKYKNKGSKMITAMYMANDRHTKANRLLFKILEERLSYWWD